MGENGTARVNARQRLGDVVDGVCRVIVVGGSSVGKSTVVNALLNPGVETTHLIGPAECCDPYTVNGTTDRVIAYVQGTQSCTLIDTVGFTDPRYKADEVLRMLQKTLYNFGIGVSAIIVVIKSDVLTDVDRRLVLMYERLYGDSFYEKAMLVVTFLKGPPISLIDYKQKHHSADYMALLNKFGDRVVVGTFESDPEESVDLVFQARRATTKVGILQCLCDMGSHSICLEPKAGSFRGFIDWFLSLLHKKRKSEAEKIYSAFVKNYREERPTCYFVGCICTVCHDPVSTDFFTSPCLHVSHFDCMRAWLEEYKHDWCPLCKRTIFTHKTYNGVCFVVEHVKGKKNSICD